MPGESARTATSSSWRIANSRSWALRRLEPSAVAERIAGTASSWGGSTTATGAPGKT